MRTLLLVACAALAAGCSSAPKMPPVFSESLITDISEQGNRFFTYKATLSMEQQGRGGPGGGMGGGPGRGRGGTPGGMGGGPGGTMGGTPGGGMQNRMRGNPEETAKERLEEILAETRYCPNGWFVIEETFDRGSAEIRGECRAVSSKKETING
ncbi:MULTISPECIES: hypothetical protein [unclassified Microbulbifer]|uniref:hypothetical protein n=1 Tax=unclassified Microbulbifer TaxID=2619833 RepID=UPI0027E3F54A|nr:MULTISPECIES: hypothetical protein [unclassified Microbulbifer]